MNWSKYNCVITTRHGNKTLYEFCSKFLKDIPYDKFPLKNTSAQGYLETIIRLDYDWVINIDDDAFLVNVQYLYDLLEYMDQGRYDYCGMADGGFDGCRYTGNPCSMNPFFNIFHLKSIRGKIDLKSRTIGIPFQESFKNLVNYTGFKLPKERCKFDPTMEPFYYFFFRLLRDTNPLFLQATLADDKLTTILYNHRGSQMIYHTWYGRFYHHQEHRIRINNIIRLVENLSFS